MLQYPTNVYPDNATFDRTSDGETNRLSFTFNGDILSGVLYKVYNYNTGALVKTGGYMPQNRKPICYNGELFDSYNLPNNPNHIGFFEFYDGDGEPTYLSNGDDYVLQLQLVQWDEGSNKPLCDMFVLRGITQEDYVANDGELIVEDNATAIYDWDTESGDDWRRPSSKWSVFAGVMYITVKGVTRMIDAYNPLTGQIYLRRTDENESNTIPLNIPKGTPYQIYCNYKVSKQFYFKCRTTPDVTANLRFVDYNYSAHNDSTIGFNVSCDYSQAQGSLISYYKIRLYWNWEYAPLNPLAAPWRLVDETDNIYSQKIEYTFFDAFYLRYKKRVNGEIEDMSAVAALPMYYKAEVEIMTADGMNIKTESLIIANVANVTDGSATSIQELIINDADEPDVYYPDSIDAPIFNQSHNLKHVIHIVGGGGSGYPQGTKFTYYRENLNTGEITLLDTVDDITVPTKGKFRYYQVPRQLHPSVDSEHIIEVDTFTKGISYKDIELDSSLMRGCSITELILCDDDLQFGTKPRYKIGDQWRFVGDIQNTTITQNGDRYVHVGYGTFPKITSTKTSYLSGSVSATNGYVDCTTKKYVDNIDVVRAWREFISRQSIYMLKTQKGDVLVVAVSDNPTTTYQEDVKELPTSFTFDWVEVCDIRDIKVRYTIDIDPNHHY